MTSISDLLEPLAQGLRELGIPEPIVHWGHPAMMGIVLFVVGGFVGLTGWKSRTLATTDPEAALKSRLDHRKMAPLMFLFIALGYTGGVLSLVMQQKSIFESSHFWTGSAIILLLTVNAVLAATQFGGKPFLRSAHAYLGSVALVLFAIHAALGLKLGLSI